LLASTILDVPIEDMGAQDEKFRDIFRPKDHKGAVPGVTKQFLGDAANYHALYFDIDYLNWLIGNALEAVNFTKSPELILDIGSGSGSSVASLLSQFVSAHVVATDVSPDLLTILRRYLIEHGKTHNCTTLCLDLNRHQFSGSHFDLAVGNAILHHLFEPDRLVSQVFPAIKPGGAMIFFEPFEPGYAMMSVVYRLLLSLSGRSRPLGGALTDFFSGKIREMAARNCTPKDVAAYAAIDDKWTFTRAYFQSIGEKIGASKTVIYPINDATAPFSEQMRTALRLGLGLNAEALPQWAWDVISEIEQTLSPGCIADLLLEGCIAFIK
jgi:SAM-dependent methyltransferase